jgi:hypothetical protein
MLMQLATATDLGIKETQFTIDGKPVFLLGMSYYGGLGAPDEFVRRDLDDLQRFGFNWIRVWATWPAFEQNLAVIDAVNGQRRQPFFDRLQSLLEECDRRGLIVDVTLARGDTAGGTRLETFVQHANFVLTLVTALQSRRNWYLDLSNERNIRDKRFTSIDELAKLRAEVKRVDPRRLVTASQGSDIARSELRAYLETAQVDFVAPHRPRDATSPAHTDENARLLLGWMREFGRTVPIHYQEPFRRGYGSWEPKANDYLRDLRGAIAGGAAGWCFHNGSERKAPDEKPRRSFDLRERRLFDQLDNEERNAITQLRSIVATQ